MSEVSVNTIYIQKINSSGRFGIEDQVAVEEPLEIQVEYSSPTGKLKKSIAVTMRTPGDDENLAAGFLFTEGIISSINQINSIYHSIADNNIVIVRLQENIVPVLKHATRNFYTTSSCGVCGKASIEAVKVNTNFITHNDSLQIPASLLNQLPAALKERQKMFQSTGGLHASALFNLDGDFIFLKEDVGRHNALDKLIGQALMNHQLPLNNHILLLSGRASFELIQKSAMAGIRIIAAVGAPSSLAIEMANEAGITLAGFLNNNRFNLYTGFSRIKSQQPVPQIELQY
jgi:FdhD protein